MTTKKRSVKKVYDSIKLDDIRIILIFTYMCMHRENIYLNIQKNNQKQFLLMNEKNLIYYQNKHIHTHIYVCVFIFIHYLAN